MIRRVKKKIWPCRWRLGTQNTPRLLSLRGLERVGGEPQKAMGLLFYQLLILNFARGAENENLVLWCLFLGKETLQILPCSLTNAAAASYRDENSDTNAPPAACPGGEGVCAGGQVLPLTQYRCW